MSQKNYTPVSTVYPVMDVNGLPGVKVYGDFCKTCGALVWDDILHDAYHADQAKAVMDEYAKNMNIRVDEEGLISPGPVFPYASDTYKNPLADRMKPNDLRQDLPPAPENIRMHTPVVSDYGIAATHDQACAVCWAKPAVLNMNLQLFEPCWDCQQKGWSTTHKRIKTRRRWFS